VKKRITNSVSMRVMIPPGMFDDEIRIAIAEELASCDEWNQSFR